ncbi:CU044_5270 family protein [Streptomyces sp. NPDC046465]|uniref:CU044_5270 family protein n=1 Tax=Streptomyces sp. NPDC046465 TaxID=3155810 RepID=UPI0033F8FA37
MTEHTHTAHTVPTVPTDLLDFPGAAELIAAGDVPPPSSGIVAAAQAAVARAARGEAPPSPARPRLRPLPLARRRRVLVAAAAVAAIAAGAVAYPVLDVGGRPAATASASQFLDDMAAVASDAPAATDPQYWKVRVETVNQDDGKRTDTTFFDHEGRVWSVDPDGTVHEPPAGEKGKVKKWPVGEKWLTWPALGQLPTDEKALAALFPADPESRFEQVAILLEDSPASPQLRGALFRILADAPGVRLVGDVRDSKGRAGVAVEVTRKSWYRVGSAKPVTHRTKDRYVVDPRTGLLLETTHKLLDRDAPVDRYTWLEVGPADRVG